MKARNSRSTAWPAPAGFLAPACWSPWRMSRRGCVLSEREWKPVAFREGDAVETIDVRLQRIAGEGREKIALIETAAPLTSARPLALRKEPLTADEPVISRAYRSDRAHTAQGRFVEYSKHWKFAGGALFEIYDGDDRMALDYGASGAPVLDCAGRVVAVVANLLTQTILGQVRVSTAWSMPNVLTCRFRSCTTRPTSRAALKSLVLGCLCTLAPCGAAAHIRQSPRNAVRHTAPDIAGKGQSVANPAPRHQAHLFRLRGRNSMTSARTRSSARPARPFSSFPSQSRRGAAANMRHAVRTIRTHRSRATWAP